MWGKPASWASLKYTAPPAWGPLPAPLGALQLGGGKPPMMAYVEGEGRLQAGTVADARWGPRHQGPLRWAPPKGVEAGGLRGGWGAGVGTSLHNVRSKARSGGAFGLTLRQIFPAQGGRLTRRTHRAGPDSDGAGNDSVRPFPSACRMDPGYVGRRSPIDFKPRRC